MAGCVELSTAEGATSIGSELLTDEGLESESTSTSITDDSESLLLSIGEGTDVGVAADPGVTAV